MRDERHDKRLARVCTCLRTLVIARLFADAKPIMAERAKKSFMVGECGFGIALVVNSALDFGLRLEQFYEV